MLRFFILKKFGTVLTEYLMLAVLIFWSPLLSFQRSFSQHPNFSLAVLKALVIALIFQSFLHLCDAHGFQKPRLPSAEIAHVAEALLLASLTLWGIWLFFPRILFGHGTFVSILVVSSVFLMIWHALLRFYYKFRPPRSNIVVLGTGRLAHDLVREIIRRPELGIRVSGFLGDDPALVGISIVNPKVIGLYTDLPQIIASKKVDHIVVELQDRRGQLPIDELLRLKVKCIGIEEAASFYERVTGKIAVEHLKPSWMIFNSGFDISKRHRAAKQILSLILTLTAAIILSPIILIVMVLVKLDSPGPIFFKQERVGLDAKTFTLWKFRSMCRDAERETGPVWAIKDDPRVTRLGQFLRRSRLDEIPQLYNVLRGDMSLIGPRPERPSFVNELSETIPYYGIRHTVRPGLTGWAQINYQYANSVEDSLEKLQYDLFYIKHMSIVLDVIIAVETIKTVLVRPGS
jgi:sugar transferase (PEP-CTERM system associated)